MVYELSWWRSWLDFQALAILLLLILRLLLMLMLLLPIWHAILLPFAYAIGCIQWESFPVLDASLLWREWCVATVWFISGKGRCQLGI